MSRQLAVMLLCATWCYGAGRVEGTVRDATEAVVPNTSILFIAEDTSFRFYASTDREGFYGLDVPQGAYRVIVRRAGFGTIVRTGVVAQGEALRIDFDLVPSAIRETLQVTDVADPDATTQRDLKTLLPQNVRSLPRNDGSVTGLLSLLPGVLFTPASRGEPGQFSSAGARPNSNSLSVDGVSGNNAVAGGGWPRLLSGAKLPAMTALGTTHSLAMLDAIQEVQVDPQSGVTQSPGANVIIRTRSGTDQLHGSLFFQVRPRQLGANDWFTNRYALGSSAPSMNEAGGTLGGPLLRSRTYFFAAAESLALRQGYGWTTTVPSRLARAYSPSSLLSLLNQFPLPNGPDLTPGIGQLIGKSAMPAQLHTQSVRIDHQVSESTRAFLRVGSTPSWSEAGLTQTVRTQYRHRLATLGITMASGRWVREFRLGASRNRAESLWPTPASSTAAPGFYPYPGLAADFSNIVVGGAGSVSLGQGGQSQQNHWEVSHTAGLQTSRHHLRFGGTYTNLQAHRAGPDLSTTLAFGTPTNLIFGPPAPVWITYSRALADTVKLPRASAFVSDTWRVSDRISLSASVNAVYVQAPLIDAHPYLFAIAAWRPLPAFDLRPRMPLWANPSLPLFPQVGFAWRLGHATVLRSSWSLLMEPTSAAATDLLNGVPYRQLRTPTGGPGDRYDVANLLPSALGYGYARDLRLPSYQRWSTELQQDWGRGGSLLVSYSGLAGAAELRRQLVLDPSPSIGALIFASSGGFSRYHGLNILYRRTLSEGLQINAAYSWSRSMDVGSSDSSVFLVTTRSGAHDDFGPSDFDVRHTANASLVYTTSFQRRGIASLASDWTMAATVFARTAFPVDALVSETLSGFAVANYRPVLFGDEHAWTPTPTEPKGRLLNPRAFGFPLPGLVPMSRNVLRGFGVAQVDVSVQRSFWRSGDRDLLFRAGAYNVTNSANFSDPFRYASNPMFGQSQSPLNLMLGGGSPSSGQSPAFSVGAPRSMQLSLRLNF